MINNYYPLYLYTIGFLFLLLFLLPPFSLSVLLLHSLSFGGHGRAHDWCVRHASKAKLCRARENALLCAVHTNRRTHTAEVTLISEKLSKANKKKLKMVVWWWVWRNDEIGFAVSFIKKLPTVCFYVFALLFISLFCVNCFCILPLLLDMNEIKSLTVYKVLYRVFFCSGFEYMHVSVHIYKHLALYFFV